MGLHAAAEAGEAGQVSAELPARDRPRAALSAARSRGGLLPPFGSPEYPAWADAYFRDSFEGQRYSALYDEAVRIAGRARNPYAAAVAIEAWFRSAGGFVYDEHPPPAGEQAPLVHFVTRSQRGYCQHFAGAMALMLRYLGIPARVAAGFSKRRLRRGTEAMDGLRPRRAHVGRGVVRRLRVAPVRPHAGSGRARGAVHDLLDAVRRNRSGRSSRDKRNLGRRRGGEGAASVKLANLGREALTPNTDPSEAAQGGSNVQQDDERGPGTAIFIVLGALGVALLFVLAKLGLRRSRYFTSDPRRIPAACRRELVEFLRDQRIDVAPSLGTRELGEFLGRRAGVDATELADALGRARYAPLARAREAARGRHELKAVGAASAGRFHPAAACVASSRCAPCSPTSASDRDGGGGGAAPAPDHRALAEAGPSDRRPRRGRDSRAAARPGKGYGSVTVVTGHLAEEVEGLLDGLDLQFVRQPSPDGSADAVRRALEAGAGLPALVTAADTVLGDGDLARVAKTGSAAIAYRRDPRKARMAIESGLVTQVVADDPALPFASAPLWLLTDEIDLNGLSGPPFELSAAFQRAIDSGKPVAAVEIGPTRDLTEPADLARVRTFPILGAR